MTDHVDHPLNPLDGLDQKGSSATHWEDQIGQKGRDVRKEYQVDEVSHARGMNGTPGIPKEVFKRILANKDNVVEQGLQLHRVQVAKSVVVNGNVG